MDFSREGGCGGPYLAAPPTSARVQIRDEFVELLVIYPPIDTSDTGITGQNENRQRVPVVPL